MRHVLWPLSLLAVTLLVSRSVASESAEALFLKGNELFRSGLDSTGRDRAEKIRQAASTYRRIIHEEGIENGYLYYNLGNCHFHLGEIGRAIVNYRRAERFIPNYADLKRNLESARSRRKDRVQKSQIRSIARTLLFWHHVMSLRTKIAVFSVFFSIIWIVLLVRLFLERAWVKWALALSILLAVAFGVSGAIESYGERSVRFGVILADTTLPRKGPGESYAPTFKEPLHEGTEFRLIDRQAQWLQVELDNGARCWLPSRHAELI
jgi:tetratricopeptide (TPR) repeat protein